MKEDNATDDLQKYYTLFSEVSEVRHHNTSEKLFRFKKLNKT